jgi:hypothetical protein
MFHPCKVFPPAIDKCDDPTAAQTPNLQPSTVGTGSKFWPQQQWLSIAFVDNPPRDLQDAIELIIWEWQPHVNLFFAMSNVVDAKIRISTKHQRNGSLIGTDALKYKSPEPTMYLGNKPDHPEFRASVLHEFGHALGLEHEHQHPKASIPWNKPEVYKIYARDYGWNKDEVDLNFFTPLNTQNMYLSPYDKQSIMHYPIENELTHGDWEVSLNSDISKRDISFIKQIYPKQ